MQLTGHTITGATADTDHHTHTITSENPTMEIIVGLFIYNIVVTVAALWWGIRRNSVFQGLLVFLFFPAMIFLIIGALMQSSTRGLAGPQYDWNTGTYRR